MSETAKKPFKIFISHSSQDMAFVQPLIQLFEYIGLTSNDMFCSSIAGYNIPLGTNIFSYLKEQFQNYNLIVIFILSENYYNSAICLNEMGAAWVLQHRYVSILLPQFDFRDVKGVIDQMQISIQIGLDKFELKSRLNELRDTLSNEFELNVSLRPQNIWERHRDEFVDKVTSTEVYWGQLRQLREKNRPLEEWIVPLQKLIEANPASYDAMYMLGTIYAEMDNLENAIKYLKMAEKLSRNNELKEKANKKLLGLGYTV